MIRALQRGEIKDGLYLPEAGSQDSSDLLPWAICQICSCWGAVTVSPTPLLPLACMLGRAEGCHRDEAMAGPLQDMPSS